MEDTARDELFQKAMPLVKYLVASERKRFGSEVETDELRSFAMLGLATALDRYDPTRNVSFSTFAEHRIRGAIYDGIDQLGWLPRRLKRRIGFYRRSQEMLHSYSNEPPPEDKVEAVHRLADRLKELATAYMTTYASENEDEGVPQPADAEYALERKRFRLQLNAAINALPKKQRAVLRSYFFEEMKLHEIARSMDISTSWASKLLSTALAHLRTIFEEQPSPIEAFQPPV